MRKVDTGWRDGSLTAWHKSHGYSAPAPGMQLPMIEYDHGKPVAVVNYLRRGEPLPTGPDMVAAYAAFGRLTDEAGKPLPFFTAVYDPRNWAFALKGHNDAARQFLYTAGWRTMDEESFVDALFTLRGRWTPDLAPYGVTYAETSWLAHEPEDVPWQLWPCMDMSQRRRNYEPVGQVRMSWRNPCLDIDFAVIGPDEDVALVVDYKAPNAHLGLDSTNMSALSSLYTHPAGQPLRGAEVAAVLAQYEQQPDGWSFTAHCLNRSASRLLAYALGSESDNTEALAEVVVGKAVKLSEAEWLSVLGCARNL